MNLDEAMRRIAVLERICRDREAEILRLRLHETASSFALDAKMDPEQRWAWKKIVDEAAVKLCQVD